MQGVEFDLLGRRSAYWLYTYHPGGVLILNPRGGLMFIDWDGGAYGHPMWDVAEMTMMTEVDEDVDRLCLEAYCGPVSSAEMSRLLHEHRAFKIMAALRLIAEVMITAQDPNFYLTAEEMGESMKISFPGEQAHLNGMVDFLRPTFEKLWNAYGHDYR